MNRRGKLAEIQVNMITKNKDAEDSDSVRENILTNEELIVDTPTAVDVITEKLKELHVFPKLEHRRRHLKQVKLIFISLFCFKIFHFYHPYLPYIVQCSTPSHLPPFNFIAPRT